MFQLCKYLWSFCFLISIFYHFEYSKFFCHLRRRFFKSFTQKWNDSEDFRAARFNWIFMQIMFWLKNIFKKRKYVSNVFYKCPLMGVQLHQIKKAEMAFIVAIIACAFACYYFIKVNLLFNLTIQSLHWTA